LAAINAVMAEHGINILGQYLKTNERIGYVITDVSRKYQPKSSRSSQGSPHHQVSRAVLERTN
jgi:D-3-phosphoglycerate dehydrogenase